MPRTTLPEAGAAVKRSLGPPSLSAAEARRLAISALGLAAPRPARAGLAHVRATARRLGAIQIDSVNVLARAHYLPTFSRYGAYPAPALDDLAYRRRELFEYWGHAACFLPIELFPLFRWRMEGQVRRWSGMSRSRRAFLEDVYREVRDRGPLAAGELSAGGKSTGPWWGWSEGKLAVEILLSQGRLAVSGRRNFERVYDLADRVIPRAIFDAPAVDDREARKTLFVTAVRAMGVGTAADIVRYFHVDAWWDRQLLKGRMPPPNHQALIDELVEENRLTPMQVEGWKRTAYVVPGARIPRTIDARAIVSPFDPILWERKWTNAVFGFAYQIEIYVPAPKRVHGYYVLPFLDGDRFAARVDLKADRKASSLIVQAAFLEHGHHSAEIARALGEELRLMARWLGLERFTVGRKGNLAPRLRAELAARRSPR
ncbi:MAG TPA: crosslink repair DNA glycosylase YcaQ family protein [Vicinamibacterales bacterium]|nr:crosslink repair DNA glycosylase YcaQ family protein [Vicinamibacterales bacterium]